jgi:hypothetical protein
MTLNAVRACSGTTCTKVYWHTHTHTRADVCSWLANLALFGAKAYAWWISSSLAVLAAFVDSFVDLLSQLVLTFTELHSGSAHDAFPVGQVGLHAHARVHQGDKNDRNTRKKGLDSRSEPGGRSPRPRAVSKPVCGRLVWSSRPVPKPLLWKPDRSADLFSRTLAHTHAHTLAATQARLETISVLLCAHAHTLTRSRTRTRMLTRSLPQTRLP